MEFFERAHIAKTKDVPRKETKSEEKIKKQLKQMLYGYNQSDNKLIKESEDLKNKLEDSSSVSGVSDLDLTNSSFEFDESKNLTNSVNEDANRSHNKDSSTPDVNLSDVEIKDTKKTNNWQEVNPNNGSEDSDESRNEEVSLEFLSDCNEELESLPDHLGGAALTHSTFDDIFDYTSGETSDTGSDEEFDPDGSLAERIFERLGETKENSKKGKKRKLVENNQDHKKPTKKVNNRKQNEYKGPFRANDDGNTDVEMDALERGMSKIELPEKQQKDTQHDNQSPDNSVSGSIDLSLLDTASVMSENSSYIEVTDESDDQTPFVSILAANVPSQSLSDVLGDYCHPTVRNLPFESQNVYSTDNSGIFRTEDADVTDLIEPSDEIGSLIPEVDNTDMVEDIDIPTDLDTSPQNLNEASTVYDETLQSEDISEREESLESMDPILINPIKVYYGKSSCILVMKHPAQMYIHGKVNVKSLSGTVEISGYILQDNKYEVYAPNYNFAQCMKTVENANMAYGLFSKLTVSGLSVSDAEEVVTSIGDYDAVINLLPLRSRKFEFVQNNFNVTDLFDKQNKNVDNCLKNASNLLGCSLYLTKPWKSLQEPVSWKQVIQFGLANQMSKGVICGGKSAGKSTFLRYYVNKLLAQGPILVIDLDPGQCEFTVAGNVSATVVTEPLLGPNFTHLRTPELSLHIGMINTMDHPKRYANAVETLITHCYNDERLKTIPWIINTMGMTNALGLKFITLTILKVKPTFLLQIDSKNQKKRFDFHLYLQTVKNLYFEDFQNDALFKNVTEAEVDYKFFISHHTEKSAKNNFSLAPRDERYLNYLAYFGELLDSNHQDLLGIVPYEVDLKDLRIVLNVRLGEDVVSAVLNGKVVALCCSGRQPGISTLVDEPLQWYGCGLIRGTDVEKGKVYVITPTSGAQLQHVNTLVYADWVPELRGPERTLPADTRVPYRTASLYHHRQLMFAPKRRFNPLQLLKMSRSS